MRPPKVNLPFELDEEIDRAIYGDFYDHARNFSGAPVVQLRPDGAWISIADWKDHRYVATPETLRRIARHFIQIGKQLKKTNQ